MNVDYFVWPSFGALQLVEHLFFFHDHTTYVLIKHDGQLFQVVVEIDFGQMFDPYRKIGHLDVLFIYEAIFSQYKFG